VDADPPTRSPRSLCAFLLLVGAAYGPVSAPPGVLLAANQLLWWLVPIFVLDVGLPYRWSEEDIRMFTRNVRRKSRFSVYGAGRYAPFPSEGRRRERGGDTAPVISFTFTVWHGLTPLAVEHGNKTLTTRPTVFNRDTKRASAGVAECRIGRSGALRTAREGKPPAESGPTVPTSGTSSDAEPGSPDLYKRGPTRPKRGRSG